MASTMQHFTTLDKVKPKAGAFTFGVGRSNMKKVYVDEILRKKDL